MKQQDGAVVDDDPGHALVVLDAKLVVLNRVAGLGIAVAASKVEEVVFDEHEHILGEVSSLAIILGVTTSEVRSQTTARHFANCLHRKTAKRHPCVSFRGEDRVIS